MLFQKTFRVPLRATDATGVIYFAELPHFALELFEEFLDRRGRGLGKILHDQEQLFPIVHIEADYAAPMRLDDQVVATLTCTRVGNKSLTLQTAFASPDGKPLGKATITHVAQDRKSMESIPLPDWLRDCVSDS